MLNIKYSLPLKVIKLDELLASTLPASVDLFSKTSSLIQAKQQERY